MSKVKAAIELIEDEVSAVQRQNDRLAERNEQLEKEVATLKLDTGQLLYNLDEAGKVLGMRKRSIERRIAAGKLRAVNEAGSRCIRHVDLMAYLDNLETWEAGEWTAGRRKG